MIGNEIRRLRKEKGWKQWQFAEEMGVKQHSVWRWESGVGVPHPRYVTKMAEIFNVNEKVLYSSFFDESVTVPHLTEDERQAAINEKQNQPEKKNTKKEEKQDTGFSWVPLVSRNVTLNEESDDIEWESVGTYPVPAHIISESVKPSDDEDSRFVAVIAVDGDSMEPKVQDGDCVLFSGMQPVSGDIAVVYYMGRVMLRGIIRTDSGEIILQASNKDYPDIRISAGNSTAGFRILGKALFQLPRPRKISGIW